MDLAEELVCETCKQMVYLARALFVLKATQMFIQFDYEADIFK